MILINMTLLNEAATTKLESLGMSVSKVYNKAWIFGVQLPNGQTVAAYPISRLNPLAPPSIYMTDSECDRGVCNKNPPSKIARSLKRWCKDDGLIPAIRDLKAAINGISK